MSDAGDAPAGPTVLMTGAGAPGASGIIRSLRADPDLDPRIVAVDMDPDAYGFALADAGHTVPPGDDEAFVPRVASIVDREGVDAVLPLTTAELQPLADGRSAIAAPVLVSDAEALAVANDKATLYRFLAGEGFDSAPAFERVRTREEFVDAVEALGYPDERVCFKPPVASGMRGFRVLDPTTDRLTHLLEEKPGAASTTLEEVLPVLDEAETFPDLVVMEYLPGAEYSVDVLAQGDAVGPVVPRTRSRTRAGITFHGTVERNEQLQAEAAAICEDLGLEYNVNLQFRYDGDGTPKLIEINPRVSGTIVMCVGAGANLPAMAVRQALDMPLPPVDVAWGTTMTRYWHEVFHAPDGAPFHLAPEGRDHPAPLR